jgi:hypothetical protein
MSISLPRVAPTLRQCLILDPCDVVETTSILFLPEQIPMNCPIATN